MSDRLNTRRCRLEAALGLGDIARSALRPDHRHISRVDDRRDFLMDNQQVAASITTNGIAIPKMEIN